MRGRRQSKYRNVHTSRDGWHFDSLKEARRYDELMLLQRAGEIRHLIADKSLLRFACVVNGHLVCTYEADFSYETKEGQKIIEDVKSAGTRTREYQIKKKLLFACQGLVILES